LSNIALLRPYDNLGVPGADLNDMLNTTASASNPFFTMILRNPNLGNTNQLDQVMALSPTVLLLWIGNNDVLGAALDGGDLTQLTSAADFQTRYTQILTRLGTELDQVAIFIANLPDVTDIPYINTLDIIFRDLPGQGLKPVLFDATFQPIDFGGGLNLPMYTAETGVAHVTLPGLIAYQQGIGVPDSAVLVDQYMLPSATASLIVAGLTANGVTVTGMPIPGDMTLTVDETTAISTRVGEFNAIISGIATGGSTPIPVIDANSFLNTLNTSGIDGASGRFVLLSPHNTAFSLDGVHPSNAGHAIIANAFIQTINGAFQAAGVDGFQPIPTLNVADYFGQYAPAPTANVTINTDLNGVRQLFRKKN